MSSNNIFCLLVFLVENKVAKWYHSLKATELLKLRSRHGVVRRMINYIRSLEVGMDCNTKDLEANGKVPWVLVVRLQFSEKHPGY